MNRFGQVIGISIFCLLFYSCQNRNISKVLADFVDREIKLEGIDRILSREGAAEAVPADLKIVVFHDSVGCSSCRIQKLYEWDSIVQYANALGNRMEIIFIFSPKKEERRTVELSLRSSGLDYPFFIDTTGKFQQLNPHIPPNEKTHTFLLDRDNKVALVGNPVNNEKLWELYKDRIRDLINAGR